VALLVAACGSPLVHVHEPAHTFLHSHHADGIELEDADEEHAAQYLDVLKAKIAGALVLTIASGAYVYLERPAITRGTWQQPEFRNHDPPWLHGCPERAPPA
jgi:hypothetical protein